jgi:hypothetical protein
VVVVLLPLSLSMDDGEAVDNAVAAVVVPLAAVTAAAVVAVDNEDGIQGWRWGGRGIQWQRQRWETTAIEYGYAMARRRWRLTPAVADGGGGRQRLTAAMDEDGCWRLTVAMDGSCVSGGQ